MGIPILFTGYMDPVLSESKKEVRSPVVLAFFVLNALTTIGIVIIKVLGIYMTIAIQEGGYLAEGEKQSAEAAAFIISVLSAWGITDAIIWGKGKRYAGYLMMIYSGLHFFYGIALVSESFKPIYIDFDISAGDFAGLIAILAPLVIDILVIWFVSKSLAKN